MSDGIEQGPRGHGPPYDFSRFRFVEAFLPLGEPACFGEISVFFEAGKERKWLLGKGLKFYAFLQNSRIVQVCFGWFHVGIYMLRCTAAGRDWRLTHVGGVGGLFVLTVVLCEGIEF